MMELVINLNKANRFRTLAGFRCVVRSRVQWPGVSPGSLWPIRPMRVVAIVLRKIAPGVEVLGNLSPKGYGSCSGGMDPDPLWRGGGKIFPEFT